MQYSNLLLWWVLSISWSTLFLIGVSVYLYLKRRTEDGLTSKCAADFVFVYVLVGLLGLYIVSINRQSPFIFAAGNIVVEAILMAYTLRNRSGGKPKNN